MDVRTEHLGAAMIVRATGRIDQTTAPAFQEELLNAVTLSKGQAIVVDMSSVDFVSSVGLRALMIALKQTQSGGGKLLIAALTPVVREVFEISRFDTVFRCFATVDAALAETQS